MEDQIRQKCGEIMSNIIDKLNSIGNFEICNRPASIEIIEEAADIMNVQLGKQVKEYLSVCGKLSFSFVELYGITEYKQLNSDLIQKTCSLHMNYPQTRGYVVIEDQGDGDYVLCDSLDRTFQFIPTLSEEIVALNKSFIDYIMQRYREVS